MNYKELLKKYIKHITDIEGVNFIDNVNYLPSEQDFSEKEVEILENLSGKKY